MKKKVTVLVSNDVTLDKRVEKTCKIWLDEGWEVEVIGVLRPDSLPVAREYKVTRLSLWAQRGFFFYAWLNVRLFFRLSFITTDVIWSNDLDTLLPAYWWSRWKGKTLIYDSHEWFTEAEGLTGRPVVKRFWKIIESFLLRRVKMAITVNESIAKAYKALYQVEMLVIRNVPDVKEMNFAKRRSDWPMPQEQKWIILQGAYIDPDRGAEEVVDAMNFLEGVHLIIAGDGRAMPILKAKANPQKVTFIERLPYAALLQLTACCDLGLSLDKPLHKNYEFSLPNKIFDYALAGIPVLASPLPEIEKLIQHFQLGTCIDSWYPQRLAESISNALSSSEYDHWKQNTQRLLAHCNWQNETLPLREWIKKLKD